jgi:hypothetical protein
MENMFRYQDKEALQWLEESDEEPVIGTASEEEEEEESEWSDEDDDDEEWQQLEQAQQLEVAQLVAQVMAGARPEEATPAPEKEATMEKEESVYFPADENASWKEWGRRLRREWGVMNDDPDEGVEWTDEEWGLWAKEQIEALWDNAPGMQLTDEDWCKWGKKLCRHTDITANDDWSDKKWVEWGKELCWEARMVTLNVEWANWAKCEWEKWGDGPAGNWSDEEWTEWGKSLFAKTMVA